MPNEIKDLRTQKQFSIEHRFFDEYLPALGGNSFMLYSVYCRLASSFHKVFPSLRTIQKYTGFSRSSIVKYNDLLAEFGLIKVEKRMSSDGDNENNIYYLLEPKALSNELKQKYYPENWEPILKSSGGPNNRPPQVVQVLDHPVVQKVDHRGPSDEPQVVQNVDRINKDLKFVVVNINTTTIPQTTVEQVCSLFASIIGMPGQTDELLKSSESILKSALKHTDDPNKAFLFIQTKCKLFQKQINRAKDKLAFIHAIVANNWSDTNVLKSQADQNIVEENKKAEESQQKAIMDSWQKLKPEVRASYLAQHIKRYYRVKNKGLSDKALKEALTTLVATGRYDNFNLDIPPRDFKGED